VKTSAVVNDPPDIPASEDKLLYLTGQGWKMDTVMGFLPFLLF
jgi:hypothetical protein